MSFQYRIEPFRVQDRSGFSSGDPELDRYLSTGLGQDLRRGFSAAFVAVEDEAGKVAGFYTLAATSVRLEDIPHDLARKLPRYPLVPAVLIGRLAVDRRYQGQGLGGELLFDAMKRAIESDIGAYAAIVHPKNEDGGAFYARYGFIPLAGCEEMFLPLATVRATL